MFAPCMAQLDDAGCFLYEQVTRLTEPDEVHADLAKRSRPAPAVAARVGGPFRDAPPEGPAMQLDAVPLQLSELIAFLARRHRDGKKDFRKLVHLGSFASFPALNEALRGPESGVLVSPEAPMPLAALVYSRVRHFRSLQLQQKHETFGGRLGQLVGKGDVLSVDLATDDAAAILPVLDTALAAGAEIVLFNVRDPNYPGIGRLWQMCTSNTLLDTVTFDQAYADAPAEGGGIGFARLLRQNTGP